MVNIWDAEKEGTFNAVGLSKGGRTIKITEHQTGKSKKSVDMPRKALPPGKRMSRTGKIYYEYRKNRSDKRGSTL